MGKGVPHSQFKNGVEHVLSSLFAKLEPGVAIYERLLTLKSTPGTWPALGSPPTGRRRERAPGRDPGTQHLL